MEHFQVPIDTIRKSLSLRGHVQLLLHQLQHCPGVFRLLFQVLPMNLQGVALLLKIVFQILIYRNTGIILNSGRFRYGYIIGHSNSSRF